MSDIIHCKGAAFDRRSIQYMKISEYPLGDGSVVRELSVFVHDRNYPIHFNGDDIDILWNQYINPPFRAAYPTFTPSWPVTPSLPSLQTWPGQTVWPNTSSGWLGNASGNPPSMLPPITKSPTATASFNSQDQPLPNSK